jgi:GNAT superfamily N-acetyltransferase
VTPTDLANLEHANMIAAMTSLATGAAGAEVRVANGVALFATGLPIRLFNQVLIEGSDATPEAIGDAVAVVRARRDKYLVNLRVGEDDRHVATVTAMGLVPMSETPWMPGMALQPIPADHEPELRTDHHIAHVTDEAALADHIRTAEAAFGLPAWMLRAMLNPAILGEPRVAIYVGYSNGEPVSTGLGFHSGRTIGVYNISTIPRARGRGYGAEMTKRVAADGAANGCDVAILQASDMGYPIYERLGYRTVVEYMGYVDP